MNNQTSWEKKLGWNKNKNKHITRKKDANQRRKESFYLCLDFKQLRDIKYSKYGAHRPLFF